MTDFPVTLNIPQYLYDRAQQLAEEKNLAIEEVLLHQLEASMIDLPTLPADEQAELDALDHLTNDTLKIIALEVMPKADQERMKVLMKQNNFGTISPDDRAELKSMVEQ